MAATFSTFKRQVKLLPGQKLGFQKGRGYYAKPAGAPAPYPGGGPAEPKPGGGNPYAVPPRIGIPDLPPGRRPPGPTPPPVAADPYAALAQEEIDRRAAELAQGGLTPQQEEIRRQQDRAAAAARADEAAITGFQTAAGDLMKGIAPEVGAAYRDAASTVGSLGTSIGGQIGEDLRAKQAEDAAFAASQGQSGGSTVDPTALAGTVGMLGGVIPGESLAAEGAARQAQAAEAVQIPLNAGREELSARMAQARETNDEYAQQLIQLAAQFPGLKAQALQQLNQYEMDKAKYREDVRVNTANIAAQKRQDAIAARSERAQEKAAGVNADIDRAQLKYRWASLEFQNAKAMAAAKKASAEGKRIDVSASKLLGHIVYQDGTENPSIKVAQSGSASAGKTRRDALASRARATSDARVKAFDYASKIRGEPVKAPEGSQGTYVAGPGQKYGVRGGVFPPAGPGSPATTNNPNRAARSGGAGGYADAQQKVWAEIDGEGLMARYGYSREQVMAIINNALARAGWKRK